MRDGTKDRRERSDLESLQAGRVEQFSRLQATARQTLGMVLREEAVDHVLVVRETV